MLPLIRDAITVLPRVILCLLLLAVANPAGANSIADFVGDYKGSAELVRADGSAEPRDMSVSISKTKAGFNVSWKTVIFKHDGRVKEQSYSVDFVPTDRAGIYSAAMRRNVFGHEVQLDPMKGEPFVWGRISGETMTIYSLFIDEEGGYEMQQFDRTLVDDGLQLNFSRIRDGHPEHSVSTLLVRQ